MIAKRVVVRGRVQGVGFRFSVVDVARAHGLVGWVRNRHDGTVEAWLQGDATAVQRVADWCRRGPRGARVTDVDVVDATVDASLSDFVQRTTT